MNGIGFRQMTRFRISFLLVLFLAAGFSATSFAGVFNPQTFTLKNGMQVVVVPNHRAPVVSHMIWYKVGSADEWPGKSGVAHFFEHLMFKGTKKFPGATFSQQVARNGGRENAFTSYDYTAYFQSIAVDRLPMVMEMEADRMRGLTLSDADIEPERLVVLEERRERTDNNPAALLSEHVNAALYLNHPYRRPIIGWPQEIKALSRDDLLKFYRHWYTPNNAVLIVAGDITAEKLRPLAEKYYGVIPRGPDIQRARPQEPHHVAPREVTLRDKRVRQPSWSRVFLAPSYSAGDSKHAYALQVLAEVLGGGATSPLYRSVVVDKKLAVAAGAGYDPDNLGPSEFRFYASPRSGITMETLAKAMEAEIKRIIENGVTTEAVERAKKRMQDTAIYARDSLRTGAYVIGGALTTGRTIEDVESWPERIAAVTHEQVQQAAKAVLKHHQSVTAFLLPLRKAKPKIKPKAKP
ncbi:MAG: pitrilysin family protein [Rhodospirillaceae bacterium]|jgi:zinc protease